MKDERATTIELFKDESAGYVDPYPWRFSITFKGVRHVYCGIPNKCRTAGAALRRAQQRLKWMENGTYASKYK